MRGFAGSVVPPFPPRPPRTPAPRDGGATPTRADAGTGEVEWRISYLVLWRDCSGMAKTWGEGHTLHGAF